MLGDSFYIRVMLSAVMSPVILKALSTKTVNSFKSFLPCPFGVVDHSAHSEESSVLGGQMPSSPLVLD